MRHAHLNLPLPLPLLTLAVLLVFATRAPAAPPAAAYDPRPPLRLPAGVASLDVPISPAGDRLYARVRVNGQDAGWFNIDTGAPATVIDAAVARRLKLTTYVPVVASATGPADARGVPPPVAEVDELSLGDAVAARFVVKVRDVSFVSRTDGFEVAGIVGGDLLSDQPFTLDFTRPALTLHEPHRFEPPAGADAEFEVDRIGLGYAAVRGSVEGRPGWFLFDTGNPHETVLTDTFARMHRLLKPGPRMGLAVMAGPRRMDLLRVDSLTLFGRETKPAHVLIAREPVVHDKVDVFFAGVAGAQDMRGGRFTFDYGRRKMWVQWPPAPSAESLVKRLTDPKNADLMGETPLMKAAKFRRADAVALLLDRGAEVNGKTTLDVTALMFAAKAGDAGATRLLLKAGADPNRQGVFEAATAMHLAAERGHAEVVKTLAAAKAVKIDSATTHGDTPLHRAAAGGYADAVAALLDARADANAPGRGGVTPLMRAASAGDTATIHLLLDRGANMNARANGRETALHWAATVEAVRALLDRGAGVNDADEVGRTALMRAASQGNDDLVRLLRSRGADVTLRTEDGQTAANIAANNGMYHMLHLLTPAPRQEARGGNRAGGSSTLSR